MTKPTVFISYSHQDEAWKDRLLTHLGVLERQGLLDLWDDRRIGAGEDWRGEIRQAMEGASVAVLLVSADFLTSQFILDEEVPRLLQRRDEEGLRVFPVVVRPCAWQRVEWLARMQLRPRDGRPLSAGDEHQIEADLAAIAEEIADIVAVERAAPSPASEPASPASPSAPPAGAAAETVAVHDKLDRLLEGQEGLRRGQAAIYRCLDGAQRRAVEEILSRLRRVRRDEVESSRELRGTLEAIRRTLIHLQAEQLPQLDEELHRTLDEVTEIVRAGVDLRTGLELTVPLVPLLLNYKATLDVGGGLDLRQAWEDLIAWVKGRKEDNEGTDMLKRLQRDLRRSGAGEVTVDRGTPGRDGTG